MESPLFTAKQGSINCFNCTKKKHFVAKQALGLVENYNFVYDMGDYDIQKKGLYYVDLILEHD